MEHLRTGEPLRLVLAANVRRYRNERGWSQERLAEKSKLTQVFVSRIETAKVAPTIDTVAALARALEVDPSLLLVTHGQ